MDRVQELIALLDAHRDALYEIAGVISTGVGHGASKCAAGEVVIQVFVESSLHVDRVSREAARILGDVPTEVIVSGKAVSGNA